MAKKQIKTTKKSTAPTEEGDLGDGIRIGGWTPKWVVSSGSLVIDSLTKFGGYPSGSIIQYYSPADGGEGSGKTTIALQGLVQLQRKFPDRMVGMVDVERTPMDNAYLEALGIDTKRFLYSRPNTGEEALSSLNTMVVKHKAVGVVFDSVDMARPQVYVDAQPGEQVIGQFSKLIRKAFQDFKSLTEEHGCNIYLVNQSRNRISASPGSGGEDIQGGAAALYYPTLTFKMRRLSNSRLMDTDLVPVSCQVHRSKIGGSWKKFELHYIQGEGFDRFSELIEIARQEKLIKARKVKGEEFLALFEDPSEPERIGDDVMDARNWLVVDGNDARVIALLKKMNPKYDTLPEEL